MAGDSHVWVKKKLVHEFREGHKYCYVVPKNYDNKAEYEISISDTPPEIVGGYVAIHETNDWYVVCSLITIIVGVFFLISTFSEMDEFGWELEYVILETLHNDIITHTEKIGDDVFYYYTIDQRLLAISQNEFITYMNSKVKEFYRRPNMFPIFEGTKHQIRENKLQTIFSN